jgi:hypothetical protein
MPSSNLQEIKAALWEQAFLGCSRVQCPLGQVMAIRRRKGQLLALIRGWGRWYPVECVTIERQFALSTRCVSQTNRST